MAKRIQSPSSINTYKQCPRKYYYIYIKKLQTLPNIHLIRGGIAHSVLEDLFKIDIDKLPDNGADNADEIKGYEMLLQCLLKDFLKQKWQKARPELEELDMTEAQRIFYYEETEQMLMLWLRNFLKKLSREKKSFKEAFKKWTPKTEEEYTSEKYQVKGFIDAIHEFEDEVVLMDYKTSNKNIITPEYKLQLAIYALLYYELHGKKPSKVGIDFLKYGERRIDVDEELMNLAKFEIEQIHASTGSEDLDDYPKKEGPLCKWHSGQCDFYEICFK